MLEEKIKQQQYEAEGKWKHFLSTTVFEISEHCLQFNLIYLSNSLCEKLLFAQIWIFRSFLFSFSFGKLLRAFYSSTITARIPKRILDQCEKRVNRFFAPQSQVLDIFKSFTYFECRCVIEDEGKKGVQWFLIICNPFYHSLILRLIFVLFFCTYICKKFH